MNDEPTRDELEFAKEAWGVMRDMVREGDLYPHDVWTVLNEYYPGNVRKQIRALGFINEVYEHYGRSTPTEDARFLAKKWGVEDLLLKERGFRDISLQ